MLKGSARLLQRKLPTGRRRSTSSSVKRRKASRMREVEIVDPVPPMTMTRRWLLAHSWSLTGRWTSDGIRRCRTLDDQAASGRTASRFRPRNWMISKFLTGKAIRKHLSLCSKKLDRRSNTRRKDLSLLSSGRVCSSFLNFFFFPYSKAARQFV